MHTVPRRLESSISSPHHVSQAQIVKARAWIESENWGCYYVLSCLWKDSFQTWFFKGTWRQLLMETKSSRHLPNVLSLCPAFHFHSSLAMRGEVFLICGLKGGNWGKEKAFVWGHLPIFALKRTGEFWITVMNSNINDINCHLVT